MSLRSRGYTTKKLIGWFFFGRGGDVQERRYNYSSYSDIPIKYPGIFSPSSMTSSDIQVIAIALNKMADLFLSDSREVAYVG